MELQCEIVDREMVTMPDGSTVDCLVITQRDPDEYYDEDEEAAAYRYYSPTHHRTVMMKTADLSELDEDMPMSTYALSPQTVETAQTFNKKYADPSKVREGEGDDSVSMLLVGGILAIVSLAGIAFFLHHRRGAVEEDSWEDAAQGPYAGGGFAYARDTPGTFSGMPTASQQNHLCQRCGTAADYIPTYQRYYCWNCRDYLPLHAPRQTPTYAQAQTPTYTPGQTPIYTPTQTPIYTPGQTPTYTPRQAPTYARAQTPMQYSQPLTITRPVVPMGEAGAICGRCGGQATYIPQYGRHYCYKCREYL